MVLLGRLGLRLGLGVMLGLVFRVRLRVCNNIEYNIYFVHVLRFFHLHSVGGATVLLLR